MTWGVHLFAFLPFHTVPGVLEARILKWFAIPFSSGPQSVRPPHHDLPVFGCPVGMAWFHWVRQGCGPSVTRLTSFLWVWFQCVCPLMPSCNTYHLSWVSLTFGVGYLFLSAPAKHSRSSLLWTSHPSWPWTWSSSSQPSCACAAAAPWMWGYSSHLLPLTSAVWGGLTNSCEKKRSKKQRRKGKI